MAILKAGLFPVRMCVECGETKLEVEAYFIFSNGKRHGLVCRECRRLYLREYHTRNRERLIQNKREYRKNNLDALRAYQREYNQKHKKELNIGRKNNPDKLKIVSDRSVKKNIENVRQCSRNYSKSFPSFKTYAPQLTIEEDPTEGEDGLLLVKCAYCGKYFIPIVSQVSSRIASLMGRSGGENRLYCSQGCKDACPIFYQVLWPKGYKKATSREVDPLIRQMCLARDGYTCQKCEKTIDEIELHAHHIEGATQMPMLANDVDNTITLCKPCHKWVHTQDGCTYYDLRKKEC